MGEDGVVVFLLVDGIGAKKKFEIWDKNKLSAPQSSFPCYGPACLSHLVRTPAQKTCDLASEWPQIDAIRLNVELN